MSRCTSAGAVPPGGGAIRSGRGTAGVLSPAGGALPGDTAGLAPAVGLQMSRVCDSAADSWTSASMGSSGGAGAGGVFGGGPGGRRRVPSRL